MKYRLLSTVGATAIVLAMSAGVPGEARGNTDSAAETARAFSAANAQTGHGPLPGFLAGTGAQPLSVEDMEEIRGERIPRWLIDLAIRQVAKATTNQLGTRLANFLDSRTRTPSYAEYRAVFGSRTALVLSALPPPLRPQIAQ